MNDKYRMIASGIAAALCVLSASCGKKPEAPEEPVPSVKGCALIHETEFGGVYIKMPIEEFNQLGFEYGDSVTVKFSNGYTMEDIPYYNGYYTQTGYS